MSYEVLVADTTERLVRSVEFTDLVTEVSRLAQVVPSVRVQDDSSQSLANEVLVRVKRSKKRLEEMRRMTKAPFLAFGQSVDNVFRPLIENCDVMVRRLDGQMVPYAVERQKREEAGRLAAQLEAQEVSDGPVSPQPRIVAAKAESDGGATTLVKVKRFEVVDMAKLVKAALDGRNKVGMDVLAVNEGALRVLVNAEVYPAGQWARYGVRVWEEDRQRTVTR